MSKSDIAEAQAHEAWDHFSHAYQQMVIGLLGGGPDVPAEMFVRMRNAVTCAFAYEMSDRKDATCLCGMDEATFLDILHAVGFAGNINLLLTGQTALKWKEDAEAHIDEWAMSQN